MAKKVPFPATGLLVIRELVLINLAFLLSYWMRYSLGLIGEVAEPNYVEYSAYLPLQVLLNGVLLLANAAGGLYRRPPSSSWVEELMGLLGATSMGMMAVLALVYLFHGLAYSRAMFLFAWALIFGLLAANRGLERLVKAVRLRRGVGVKRVVVVGGENLGRQVMHVIATEPGLGYQLAGFVQENGIGDLGRFRSLGKVEELSRVLEEHQIDEVIVALPSSSHYLI